MANEELVNRLRERAKTLWQWAGRAERTTGPSVTTREWRTDGDLHDDAAAELARLSRELEAARAALMIAETTAANLHDTIRLRDRELEAEREKARRLREAVLDTIRKACRCEDYYRAIEREDPQCQAHDIEYYVEQVFEASG